MSAVFDNDPRQTYEWTFDVEESDMTANSGTSTNPAVAGYRYDPEPSAVSASPHGPGNPESDLQDLTGDVPAESFATRILKNMELSTVLRVFGAGVVVTAIGVFLFQHWEAGNDLFRYSMLLGQTVILSLLGFGTARFMKEPKSARVFLSLGLVSTAASFTILGALLYSVVQWDAVSVAYPGFAYWQVGSVN